MQVFFLAIVNMSITSGVVVLLLFILRPLLKKLPRRIAYALWGVVLIRLLMPFSFPSPAPAGSDRSFGGAAAVWLGGGWRFQMLWIITVIPILGQFCPKMA